MGEVTTAPALKAKLRDVLAARVGLRDVKVSWGWPKAVRREMIVLGNVNESEQEYVVFRAGRKPREESYTLEVLVRVEQGTNDQEPVTLRAYAIAAELEDALRADFTVGGVVRTAEFESGDLEELGDDGVRLALLNVRVHCKARI
jgi:hypothetical protein